MTGIDLIAEARKLLGTPHYHMGRSAHGVDCAGVILLPAWRMGLTEFNPRTYSPGEGGAYLLECLERECVLVEEMAEPGDILVFRIRKQVQHLGYLTGTMRMLHCREQVGVVESTLDERWQERIAGVYRWKALAGD